MSYFARQERWSALCDIMSSFAAIDVYFHSLRSTNSEESFEMSCQEAVPQQVSQSSLANKDEQVSVKRTAYLGLDISSPEAGTPILDCNFCEDSMPVKCMHLVAIQLQNP